MAALVVAQRNQERKRELAVEAAKNNAAFVKDILKRHDLSNTQTLKFEEVRSWLQVVGNAQSGSLPRERANSLIEQNFPGTAVGLAVLSPPEASTSKVATPPKHIDDNLPLQFLVAEQRKS